LPEAANVGGKSIFWAQNWVRAQCQSVTSGLPRALKLTIALPRRRLTSNCPAKIAGGPDLPDLFESLLAPAISLGEDCRPLQPKQI
jgi:hypothetical protein